MRSRDRKWYPLLGAGHSAAMVATHCSFRATARSLSKEIAMCGYHLAVIDEESGHRRFDAVLRPGESTVRIELAPWLQYLV